MKYISNIEVDALQFTLEKIDEAIDFICDGDPFDLCFTEDRETIKKSMTLKKKIHIEHPKGMVTAYIGDYLVKFSKDFFQVWGKEEFERIFKNVDRI